MIRTLLAAVAAGGIMAAGAAQAQDKIKIGVLATLEGALTTLGEDAMRGMQIAMKQASAKAGGKTIEVVTFPTNATPDSAIRGARKLVEQDKVDILIGPVSGSEGIAIRDYSKTQPQRDLPQRLLRRHGDDLRHPVRELLPLQHGRRAVARRARQVPHRGEEATRRSPPSRRTIPSPTRSCSGSRRSTARRAARSSSASGCRSAPRISARSSRSCRTTSTRSISASAAATP